ncbi:MAG: tripartite tricarboxylate transporter substrate binding protein, partial [Pseudomonadota bacterium]
MKSLNLSRRACMAALALGLAATGALAQSGWPHRPIKLLVPAPAGGATDVIARAVADALQRSAGQPVVVDNKPGAGGIIAVEAMLSAPKDGHTFVLSANSLVMEVPHLLKLRYDVFTDLAAVAELARVPLVLVTDPRLPIRNVAEMVAYVKAHPGKTSYASYSAGTLSHIKGAQFNRATGTDMQHVGYKGSPPALQDVMAGQVQFMFDGMGTSVPLVKAGKLRALAVTSPTRSPLLPEVPTLAELGYGDLTQTMGTGIWSTPDVPAAVRNQLRAEIMKALAVPALREQLRALAMEPGNPNQTSEDFTKVLKQEYERTGQLLKSIDYKP